MDNGIFILCNEDALGDFFDNTSASGRADTLSVIITINNKKQITAFSITFFLILTTTYLHYV
ncbi:hypothetical protein MNV_1320007 [Candidatus Methanoperedens nitroreducens]|uniref:Uncharacterized protein n=1 Tax=Candidatus Methanoperedens nitratireducens TaxID=1392998 RepID=A0A284VKE7_9EURY|nr:hypothetical protein MNV_1320007 [Candidatus Methanoperedens nitroreducens]